MSDISTLSASEETPGCHRCHREGSSISQFNKCAIAFLADITLASARGMAGTKRLGVQHSGDHGGEVAGWIPASSSW